MIIKRLEPKEILPALQLVWEVFSKDVAPTYEPEGVEAFRKFITYDNIGPMISRGELLFWGAWEEKELLGVAAIKNDGHISLLFVKEEQQNQGVGRALYDEMCCFTAEALRLNRISVNAAPSAVDAYTKYGMKATGPQQTANGIIFVPMEMPLTPAQAAGPAQAAPKKKTSGAKIALIVAIVATIVIGLGGCAAGVIAIGKAVRDEVLSGGLGDAFADEFRDEFSDEFRDALPDGDYSYDDDFGDIFGGDYDGSEDYDSEDGWYDEEPQGLDAIEGYEEQGTGYTVTDEVYEYTSEDTRSTVIQFEVGYPKIEGLDASVAEKVNKTLQDTAMETVDAVYLNPSQEMKEKVLGEQIPVLSSFVNYKVTYLSKDLISVIYEDDCYEGSAYDAKTKVRTVTMNLTDGTVYEIQDIIKLDDKFLADWVEEMRDQADDPELLSTLSNEQLKNYLEGKDDTGAYTEMFFLDEYGLEIGLSFDATLVDATDANFLWVSAPFDFDETTDYRTDSDFWKLVK